MESSIVLHSNEATLLTHWRTKIEHAVESIFEKRGASQLVNEPFVLCTALETITDAYHSLFNVIKSGLSQYEASESQDTMEIDEEVQPTKWWLNLTSNALHPNSEIDVEELLSTMTFIREMLFSNASVINVVASDFESLIYSDKLAPVSGLEAALSRDLQLRLGKVLLMHDLTIGYEALALYSLEQLLHQIVRQTKDTVLTHDLIRKFFVKDTTADPLTIKNDQGIDEDPVAPNGEMDVMLAAFLGDHTDAQNALQAGMMPSDAVSNSTNTAGDDPMREGPEKMATNLESATAIIEQNFSTVVGWLANSRLRTQGTTLCSRRLTQERLLVCPSTENSDLLVNEHMPPISLVSAPYELPKLQHQFVQSLCDSQTSATDLDIEDYLAEPGALGGGPSILSQLANILGGSKGLISPHIPQYQSPRTKQLYDEDGDDVELFTTDPDISRANQRDYLGNIDSRIDLLAGDLAEAFCVKFISRLVSLLHKEREWLWSVLSKDRWYNKKLEDVEGIDFIKILLLQIARAIYAPKTSKRHASNDYSDSLFTTVLPKLSLFLAEPFVERLSFAMSPTSLIDSGLLKMLPIGYDDSLRGLRIGVMRNYTDVIANIWRVFEPSPDVQMLWSRLNNGDELLNNLGVDNSMPDDLSAEIGYLPMILPPSTTYHWMIDPLSVSVNTFLVDQIQGVVLCLISLHCNELVRDEDPEDVDITKRHLHSILEEYQQTHPVMRPKLVTLLTSLAHALPALRPCILPILPTLMSRAQSERCLPGTQWSIPISERIKEEMSTDSKDIDALVEHGVDPTSGPLWDGGWLQDSLPSATHASFRLHKGALPPAVLPQVFNTNEHQLKEQIANAAKTDSNIAIVVSTAFICNIATKGNTEVANEIDNQIEATSVADGISPIKASSLLDSMAIQHSTPWDSDWLVADVLIPFVANPKHKSAIDWRVDGSGSFRCALSKLSIGHNQGAALGDPVDALSLFAPEHYRNRVWPKEETGDYHRGVIKGRNQSNIMEIRPREEPPVAPLSKPVFHWQTWGYLERHFMLQGAFQYRMPPNVTEDEKKLGCARLMSDWYLTHDRIHLSVLSLLLELVCDASLMSSSIYESAEATRHLCNGLLALRLPVVPASLAFSERKANFMTVLSGNYSSLRFLCSQVQSLRSLSVSTSKLLEVQQAANNIEWTSATFQSGANLKKFIPRDESNCSTALQNYETVPASVFKQGIPSDYGVYMYGHALSTTQLSLPAIRSLYIQLAFFKSRMPLNGLDTFDIFHDLTAKYLTELHQIWSVIAVEMIKTWMCLTQRRNRKLPGVPQFKPTNQRTSAGFLTLPDVASLSHVTDILKFLNIREGLTVSPAVNDRLTTAVMPSKLYEAVMGALVSVGPLAAWLMAMKIASPRSLQDFAFGLRFFHIDPIPESCKVAINLEPNHTTLENERLVAEHELKDAVSEELCEDLVQSKLKNALAIIRTFCSVSESLTEHLMPSSCGYLNPLFTLHWSGNMPSAEEWQESERLRVKLQPSESIVEQSVCKAPSVQEQSPAPIVAPATTEMNGDDEDDLYADMDDLILAHPSMDTLSFPMTGEPDEVAQQGPQGSQIAEMWGMGLSSRIEAVLASPVCERLASCQNELAQLQECKTRLNSLREIIVSSYGRSTGLPSMILPHDFVATDQV